MKVNRGDVLILDHPFSSGAGSKVRPALVVQNNARNAILTNTIVAMITRNLSRIGIDPTQLLIDVSTAEGQQSGLLANSAVTCGNLFTIHEHLVQKKIGELSDATMKQIDDCLRVTLSL